LNNLLKVSSLRKASVNKASSKMGSRQAVVGMPQRVLLAEKADFWYFCAHYIFPMSVLAFSVSKEGDDAQESS
jgi:hypothetical protein